MTLKGDTSISEVSPVSPNMENESGDTSKTVTQASSQSVTAESPSGQGFQGSGDTSDTFFGKTFSEKNLEKTEKQFLPIGTWVCRYGREYFQVAVHYPQWEGFAKPDGTIIGALDPKDYEVVEEPPVSKQKGLEVGTRVKYSDRAIQMERKSRERYQRSTGREDDTPWSPDWEYRIEAIDPDDTCHLKRLGGGKGKRTKEIKATWLEVVK